MSGQTLWAEAARLLLLGAALLPAGARPAVADNAPAALRRRDQGGVISVAVDTGSASGARRHPSVGVSAARVASAAGSARRGRRVPCAVSLAQPGRIHGEGAAPGSVEVETTAGCRWTVAVAEPWIHVTGGTSARVGAGLVSYAVDANPTFSERRGTIVVQTRAYTVTQSGRSCALSLAPASVTLAGVAGGGSFGVTLPAGCGWTATTATPWVHLTAPVTGNGNGTVVFAVDANPAADRRTGAITVQGQTFTVRQDGGPEITITLPGGVPLVLVRIPAGTFFMGSPDGERGRESFEGPRHQVTITRPFYLGKREVTQEQWQAMTGSNPSQFGCPAVTGCAVDSVTWNDNAVAGGFIALLNQQQQTKRFRLPPEAEWEYAARAGTTTRFSHGDVTGCGDGCEICPTHESYVWWCGNTGVEPSLANPWGLFHMHGNVIEWVQDWYSGYPGTAQVDPSGPSSGSQRVARGGAWSREARECRSAKRFASYPEINHWATGFRLARSVAE